MEFFSVNSDELKSAMEAVSASGELIANFQYPNGAGLAQFVSVPTTTRCAAVSKRDLALALSDIVEAETNGFRYCQAKFIVDGKYYGLLERASETNQTLNWGVGQYVTKSNRFVDGDLEEIPHTHKERVAIFNVMMERVKATFPDGPWQTEPDRLEWEHDGMNCLIVRNLSGALCGYVGVPESHPWHGVHYDEPSADVHGGLNYGSACNGVICHSADDETDGKLFWFGFDTAHWHDLVPSMLRNISKIHGAIMDPMGDVYWNIDMVRQETNRLAEQAKAAA